MNASSQLSNKEYFVWYSTLNLGEMLDNRSKIHDLYTIRNNNYALMERWLYVIYVNLLTAPLTGHFRSADHYVFSSECEQSESGAINTIYL